MKIKVEFDIDTKDYAKNLEDTNINMLEDRVYEMLEKDIAGKILYFDALGCDAYRQVYREVEHYLQEYCPKMFEGDKYGDL